MSTTHPIIFSSSMVRAICEGYKTQTRRIGARYYKWQPGDLLWVKETFKESGIGDVYYRADGMGCGNMPGPWRPAIFMPRKVSRLTLCLLGRRFEPLQEIASVRQEEVLLEGWPWGKTWPERDPVHDFAEEWDAINGKRGFAWTMNPWVWVLTFEVVPSATPG